MAEILSYLGEAFLQRAILAGALVSLIAGVLGVFVVFKGASFFSDAIAHASLSGVALGLLLNTWPLATALAVALALAFLLHALARSPGLKLDTALGLVFSLGTATGVLLLSLREGYQPELVSFLFGNILAVGWGDVAAVAVYSAAALVVIWRTYPRLLLVTFDPVSAHVNGVRVGRVELLFEVLLTATVVAGIRLLGVVLVNALLVIPAATARLASRSVRGMLLLTPTLGLSSTLGGIALSVLWDLPTGPTIVVVASLVFFAVLGGSHLRG